ncbi:hypothetical protein GD1_152 [Paraglaciecola Antarctic GD virus 1]|nr:hypothetical protein GD1_152 [Paraglaciecola Antarctic GD virus 1]
MEQLKYKFDRNLLKIGNTIVNVAMTVGYERLGKLEGQAVWAEVQKLRAKVDVLKDYNSTLATLLCTKTKHLTSSEERLEVQEDRNQEIRAHLLMTYDPDKDLDYKNDQGSERREFEHGQYCGRVGYCNSIIEMMNKQVEKK